MGYEVDQQYRLVWPESSPFHGLEVVFRSMDIDTMFRLDDITASIRQTNDRELVRKLYRERAEIMQAHACEWNATRNGNPLPFNADGILSLEPRQMHAICNAWIKTVTEVPDPLSEPSSDGEPYPEESIPMEP
jgi:hypothetical protein